MPLEGTHSCLPDRRPPLLVIRPHPCPGPQDLPRWARALRLHGYTETPPAVPRPHQEEGRQWTEMAPGHHGDRNPGWPVPRAGPTGVSAPAPPCPCAHSCCGNTETHTAQSWHGSGRPTPVCPESSMVSVPELSSYVPPPGTQTAGASRPRLTARLQPARSLTVSLGSLSWNTERATESSAPRVPTGTPATRRGPQA